jgi:hypothetical protein
VSLRQFCHINAFNAPDDDDDDDDDDDETVVLPAVERSKCV